MRATNSTRPMGRRPSKVHPKASPITASQIRPAILSLWDNLQAVLRDESFGLLRWTRIVFMCIHFLDPFMWLCHIADMISARVGKVFTEIFVLLKLFFPLTLLVLSPSSRTVFTALCVYIIVETLVYVWGIVLSSDSMYKPTSLHRSLLLLIIGFFAVNMAFAWLYYQGHHIRGMSTTLDAAYFSLVTAATVGFGDMVPLDADAKGMVIVQVLSSVLYLTVFFGRYLGRLGENKSESRK